MIVMSCHCPYDEAKGLIRPGAMYKWISTKHGYHSKMCLMIALQMHTARDEGFRSQGLGRRAVQGVVQVDVLKVPTLFPCDWIDQKILSHSNSRCT